jgi:ectoine hydroxylase-related dioxygenase (phytanoyl-CoA dioxygenase family)
MSESTRDLPRIAEEFEQNGFVVLERLLSTELVSAAREALWTAVRETQGTPMPPGNGGIDPNDKNIRVFDLLKHHRLFFDLAFHPEVIRLVRGLISDFFLLSNFSANIAMPGSGSMTPHCDQSTVMPPPWRERRTVTVAFCLSAMTELNGATRYLPGSHRFSSFTDLPADIASGMRSFTAPAGSLIVWDGRLWHTSGVNRTADSERPCLLALYTESFIRAQTNWWMALSPELQRDLPDDIRQWLGLATGNVVHGSYLLRTTGD